MSAVLPCHALRRFAIAAVALVVLLVLSATAHACTRTWAAGAGDWDNPANWSPAGVPGADDDVCLPAAAPYVVIVTGRASVDVDGQGIRELGAGEYLGEISLIDGGPRTATVTAIESIEALVLPRVAFDRLIDEFPAVRMDVLAALARRIRERAPALSD